MSCRKIRNKSCVISDFRCGVNEVLQIAVYEELVNGTVTALNPASYVYTHTHTHIFHISVTTLRM